MKVSVFTAEQYESRFGGMPPTRRANPEVQELYNKLRAAQMSERIVVEGLELKGDKLRARRASLSNSVNCMASKAKANWRTRAVLNDTHSHIVFLKIVAPPVNSKAAGK